MHFRGFARIDLSYADMPISNFRSQKDYYGRPSHSYTKFSGIDCVTLIVFLIDRKQGLNRYNRIGNKA